MGEVWRTSFSSEPIHPQLFFSANMQIWVRVRLCRKGGFFLLNLIGHSLNCRIFSPRGFALQGTGKPALPCSNKHPARPGPTWNPSPALGLWDPRFSSSRWGRGRGEKGSGLNPALAGGKEAAPESPRPYATGKSAEKPIEPV